MVDYTLVYDPGLEEKDQKAFFEKLDPAPKEILPFPEFSLSNFTKNDTLLLWVSDEQGHKILSQIKKESPCLVFLPHPDLIQLAKSFGVKSSKSDAFAQFKENPEPEALDLLEVNATPCYNSLVIGEKLSVLYDPVDEHFFKAFRSRFSKFIKLFRKVTLKTYQITYQSGEDEKSLEVAAMGILAVGNNESNLIFKRLIKDSGLNDGYLHVLILAPKSLFSILGFGLQNLFFPIKGGRIPDFISYISTEKMEVACQEKTIFAKDGVESDSELVQLKISEKKIRVLTGFEEKEKEKKQKELNVAKLPTGKLREELTKSYLPWFRHATTEEFKDLFILLKQNSQTSSTYLVLMALSTLIATFGLFADSGPVVIGAMILAPLMGPIVALAMGALRQDGIMIKSSLIAIFWGVLLGLSFAVLITWLTPLQTTNSEILARIRPNLLDLGIAVASGVAGAFAFSKEEVAKTLAGVAISVALVPPLAVAGIGLGWGEWNIFWGASLLLGTNLAGIVMAAALTFLVLGFSPFQLAKKGILVSLLVLVLITTPLVLSFREMVRENRIIQELSGKEIPHGLLREVKVLNSDPLRLSLTILSGEELNQKDFLEIKTEIEEKLNQEVELELTLGVMVGPVSVK
ncbi:putative hydrophobic protein (TIGR00271 family) [Algoriphagus boseongensis]|uniref:Putative hydrophobic protein (TIGR00271 family) n=1 Tax=Algoriphagus boseongensis TaxID=1442587 RepID=A0A4R6T2B8_9BACT|nr:DUF389 domain-containing protein [Algoriphagus boseongensis]TDQ15152.1 putative hydrophobic protein (TIGR00271 family) [Algoriphagus boseongensis]